MPPCTSARVRLKKTIGGSVSSRAPIPQSAPNAADRQRPAWRSRGQFASTARRRRAPRHGDRSSLTRGALRREPEDPRSTSSSALRTSGALGEVDRGDVDPWKRPRVHVRRPFCRRRAQPCRVGLERVEVEPVAKLLTPLLPEAGRNEDNPTEFRCFGRRARAGSGRLGRSCRDRRHQRSAGALRRDARSREAARSGGGEGWLRRRPPRSLLRMARASGPPAGDREASGEGARAGSRERH